MVTLENKANLFRESEIVEFSPRLVFLGERKYVHASNLYDAIFTGLLEIGAPPALGPVKLDIHALITRQLTIYCSTGKGAPPAGSKPSSYFDIGTEDGSIHGYALEGDELITRHEPFDESIIEAASEFEDKCVRITGDTGMSPIKIVLSLNKQLHSVLGLDKSGKKMLAARLELARPFVKGDAIEMSVTLKNIIGSRLTRTTIRSGENVLGSLYTSQEE